MEEKSYAAALDDIVDSHPSLAKHLRASDATRQTLLDRYKDGARLKGAEELFVHLNRMRDEFANHPQLAKVEFLLERAFSAFEVCMDAGLGGYFAVALDSVRAVMEIEFLFLEFATTPASLDDWLTCSDEERRQQYSSSRLRQLRANRLGVDITELRDHHDYKGHSLLLHVVPFRAFPLRRVRLSDPHPWQDAFFWELYEHGRRLFEAIDELAMTQFDEWVPAVDREELAAFRTGWERVTEWQSILRGIQSDEHDNEGAP